MSESVNDLMSLMGEPILFGYCTGCLIWFIGLGIRRVVDAVTVVAKGGD